MKIPTRHGRRRAGTAWLEFYFVVPIILGLAAAMIQFGMISQATEIVTNLSREGARLAAQGAGKSDAEIRTYVLAEADLSPLDPNDITVEVSPANGAPARVGGSPVTVTVSYDLSKRIILPGTSWMLGKYRKNGKYIYTAQAVMRILS